MEHTLGKRIAMHRKKLGLTQEALAEKLGITAQAVSKWENDLSCPDIAMLPRLAEIFGITTDELLGHQNAEKVHEGEVVDEGVQVKKGDWEFHWDGSLRGRLFFPLFVLWVGGLTLAARILQWGASFWDILWPSAILFTGFSIRWKHFSVFHLGCLIVGGYFLVSNLGFWSYDFDSALIFPLLVVLFGLGLLIDVLKKPKKRSFHIHKGGKHENTKIDCKNEGNTFQCDVHFGDTTHAVTAEMLEGGNASVNFGELKIDLSQVEAIASGCEVDASCSFGTMIFLVPQKFRVELLEHSHFADVKIQGHPEAEPEGIITLHGNVHFGEIIIRYI